MSQISPPVRILLAAAVVFAALWMLVLKPGGESTATTAPAAATPAATTAATSSGSTTAAATTAKAAAAPADADPVAASALPKAVKRAIAHDKVLVLLFWNGRSSDDRAVARELTHLPERDAVLIRKVKLGDIGAYRDIARGVEVQQSPTTVVVDRDLQATALVGYADHTTIDQAITDALRVR